MESLLEFLGIAIAINFQNQNWLNPKRKLIVWRTELQDDLYSRSCRFR